MMKRKRQEGPASPKRSQNGQTMLLTVMILSSAVLGATVLASLLVLFQLRQSSDAKSSTQAIFAADSGIECILFERIGGTFNYQNCGAPPATPPQIDLDNGAFYTVVELGGGDGFKSVGRAGRTTRAFEITF